MASGRTGTFGGTDVREESKSPVFQLISSTLPSTKVTRASNLVEEIYVISHRSPDQITQRLDRLIADIRARFHSPALNQAKPVASGTITKDATPSDVLVVAHGHVLRAFAARWINKNIAGNPSLILEAGGVGTLR